MQKLWIYINNLENKVRFMLRSNLTDDQCLPDGRFADLTQDKDCVPVIQEIKVNEDTALNLAKEMPTLRQTIASLQQQNQNF